MENNETVGQNIAKQIEKILEEENMSKIDLAKLMKKTKQTVYRQFEIMKENGIRIVSILDYAKALHRRVIIEIQGEKYDIEEISVGTALKMQMAKYDFAVGELGLINASTVIKNMKKNVAQLRMLVEGCKNLGFTLSFELKEI